jgi:DNA-binding NtrC family response regulator
MSENGKNIRVMAVEGPQRGSKFEVHAGASIGRSRTCAVRLEGRHISRVHARFEPRGTDLAIVDADSRNGVFVNGEKVKDRVLKKDDEIEIGEHVLIFDPSFEVEGAPAPASAEAGKGETAGRPRGAGGAAVLDALVNPFADAAPERTMAVVDAVRGLTDIEDDKDFGKALLDRLMKATGARRGFVMVADERGRMKPLAKAMPDNDAEFYVSNVLYHQVNKERKAIVATDVARGGPQAGKPISIVSAPLFVGEAYVGFVYLDGPADGTPPQPCFTKDHLRFVGGIASLAAPVVGAVRRASRARHTVKTTLRRLEAEHPMIAHAGPVKEIADKLEAVSGLDTPVLLVGETGTGREHIARSLHLRSARGTRVFTVVDACALPAAALDVALFGSEAGPGAFETTKGGTVFLRGLDVLSPEQQAKLQKALEERITRAGSPGLPSEARFVASTTHDLETLAREGRFKKELFAKFATVLKIPPLRQRQGEIAHLVAHFLKTIGGRHGGALTDHVSPDVMAVLQSHAWPGNVRELRNVVDRMLLAAGPKPLGPEHLPGDFTMGDLLGRVRKLVKGDVPLTTLMADLEKAALEEALRRTGGNKAAAADLLGVSRPTLLEKLKVYAIGGDAETAATKPPE